MLFVVGIIVHSMSQSLAIVEKLQNLGLSEKQARIYTTLLKHGPATVLQVFRDTRIQRPTIYENAHTLETLGLIETVVKGTKKYLVATNKEQIFTLIEEKRVVAKELMEDIASLKQDIIPRTPIKLYGGKDGAKRLSDAILRSKNKTIMTIGNYDLLYTLFDEKSLHRLWTARSRKKIHARILFSSADKAKFSKNKDYSEIGNIRYNRDVRLLPPNMDFHVMYTIVDDEVLFWSSLDENFFFQFSSKSYATSLRTLFETLWGVSSPLENSQAHAVESV